MPDPRRVRHSPRVPDDLLEKVRDVGCVEELLRGGREQLDGDVVDDRLAEVLHHSPDLLEKQLRECLGAGQGKAKRGLDELFDHAPIGMALLTMDLRRLHLGARHRVACPR